jgi:hypothetical protein
MTRKERIEHDLCTDTPQLFLIPRDKPYPFPNPSEARYRALAAEYKAIARVNRQVYEKTVEKGPRFTGRSGRNRSIRCTQQPTGPSE